MDIVLYSKVCVRRFLKFLSHMLQIDIVCTNTQRHTHARAIC